MSRYPIVQTWKKYSKWKTCEQQSARLFSPPPCQGLVVGCLVEERLEMSCLLKTGTANDLKLFQMATNAMASTESNHAIFEYWKPIDPLFVNNRVGRLARKEWVCQKFRRLASNPIHGSHQGSYFFNLRFKNRSFVVRAEATVYRGREEKRDDDNVDNGVDDDKDFDDGCMAASGEMVSWCSLKMCTRLRLGRPAMRAFRWGGGGSSC